MKEIDFIPEWYTANQNRRKSYHRQYVLLCSLTALLVSWSFMVGHYVENVRADVEEMQSIYEKAKSRVDEGIALEADIAMMQHQAKMLDAVTPRTPISAMIAELSWLIRENIVLSKLTFTNETIDLVKEQPPAPSASVVQIGSPSRENGSSGVSAAPKRTRVILTGISASPADAAALISRLEESNYFEQVSPIYTRGKKVKDYDVTEFEIRMFVADYKIEK